MQTYLDTLRLFGRNVRLVLVSGIFVTASWMGIYTVLFNLYLLRLGYNLTFIGLTAATMALGFALFSLPAGGLASRWGIQRTMVLGYIIAAVALTLLPLSMFIPVHWRTGWILGTYSIGIGGVSLYMVNAAVYLMNATGRSERNHVFAVQSALSPMASFSGILIGGFLPGLFAQYAGGSLDNPAPYGYSLLVAAGVLTLGIPVLLATNRCDLSGPGEEASDSSDTTQMSQGTCRKTGAPIGIILFLSVVQLIQGVGDASAITFYSVYLDTTLNTATHIIGITASISRLFAIPAALLTPLLIERWHKGTVFVRASLAMACCLLPMAFVPQLWVVAVGYAGVIIMATIWRPSIQIYRMEIVSPRWRAVINGASNMAMGLAWSSMSLGGARIAETTGYGNVFLVSATLTIIGTVLFWFFDRVPRGEFARPAASVRLE